MPVITSNNRVVIKNDRLIYSIDMSWQSKITNWLTGDAQYLTKSGNNVLTWTDKVNGNIWTYRQGSVTHIAGTNSVYLGGGLDEPINPAARSEIYVVHKVIDLTGTLYNYLASVWVGDNSASKYIVWSVNGGHLSILTGTNIKTNIGEGVKYVFNATGTIPRMILGVRGNGAFPFLGNCYEFLLFSSVLTTSQRAGLNEYMKILHPDIAN